MEIIQAQIVHNLEIAPQVYYMELACSFQKPVRPGQFVQVQIPGYYLRRPISICEIRKNALVLIYKTVGSGTRTMAEMKPGQILNVFGPLGHGFSVQAEIWPVLIGGGVGVPPLYELAKRYVSTGVHPVVVLGFNTLQDMFLVSAFEKLGLEVTVATMDGSFGVKGTVLDALREKEIYAPYIQACGPLPMLKAIQAHQPAGEISLEARMACGIGACMGCVVMDPEGRPRRVCKDGPVFDLNEVVL